jgi:aminoglycoside phosphotransferase (APT) family kinase protein
MFTLTLQAAAAAARKLLKGEIDTIAKVSSAAGNQVFRVRSDDLVAFLKIAEKEDLRREVGVLELLAHRAIPVPSVLGWDGSGELCGRPCALLAEVGGRPLSGHEPDLGGAGRLLRQVHTIEMEGFGLLVVAGHGLRGPDPTWGRTMMACCDELGPAVDAGLVPPELVARAITAVGERRDLLDATVSGCLLHGDFHPRHLYVAGGSITGIIDWGDASVGDPLYDLGRLIHAAAMDGRPGRGRRLVDALLTTYYPRPPRLAESPELLFVYAAVFSLWSMTCELEGGAPWPPWWPAQCRALTWILDQLERGPA